MGVLYANVGGAWQPVIGTPVAPAASEEVHVGDTDPKLLDPTSTHELWYDTAASVLNVWVGGSWISTTATTTGAGEVFIGPADPAITSPETELWFDSDAVVRAAPAAASAPPPTSPPPVADSTGLDAARSEIAHLRARVVSLEEAINSLVRRPPRRSTKGAL